MKSIQIPRRFTRNAWGGTETVVLETSKRLNAMGHEAKIFCPGALDPVREETIDGVSVTRLPYFYPYLGLSAASRSQMDRKGGNLFSPQILARLLLEPDVDVLHAHTGKRLGGIVRLAARLRGIPYVVSLHGGAYDVSSGEAASWTEPSRGAVEWGRALGFLVGSRRVLSDAAAVICLGENERRLVERAHPRTRAVVLPNGVDPVRFKSGDRNSLRARLGVDPLDELLLVAGRIDPQKNQALALDILAALQPSRPRLRLAFMGPVTSPAYLESLRQSAERLGVAERVIFFEAAQGSKDLADAYAAADVVLVPSAHEPFGIVVLEAWASTRPVIASRVGGLVDLISDGRDGRLIDPADVGSWIHAVVHVLDRRPAAWSMACAGRAKALKSYTWDAVAGKLLALYEEVSRAGVAKTPRAVANLSAEPSRLSL
ncbi:MAG: glycosyltransferase family 4 protein [Vicinamibacteria bacterium]|nr:glycosyltransferase family 4 protein [Vicinamibacteria bacterium]